jgi:thermitase
MAQIHSQYGGQVQSIIPAIEVQVINIPRGKALEKVKAYSTHPKVSYAESDFQCEIVGEPDDTYFGEQWGLNKVKASQAWDIVKGSSTVNIAILDTGIDSDHADLASKIVANANFSNSSTTDDIYGHGTHVAGIAAAGTNNGIGVAGIGYDSTLMNVKVLSDSGSGYYSWVASGIIWAADNGAEVINLSLGGTSISQTLEEAVNYAWGKGVVIVAAAGNSGTSSPFYPAYYTNCIAVAATDSNDSRPYWSNYGDWVDVAAPGSSIYSTTVDGGYGYKNGTSMASPHVAGLSALIIPLAVDSNGNGLLNDDVRNTIEVTADDIGVSGIGSGRINAYRAVSGTPQLTGSITGTITNASNGLPIEGAKVSIYTRTATSDGNGDYIITNVPEGDYAATAFKEGYDTSSLIVIVMAGETTTASFALTEKVVEISPMWIDSIDFSVRGQNLFIEVGATGEGEIISGARVDLQLVWSGGKVWHFGGITDISGMVQFKLGKAPAGDYLATVTGLTCGGYDWDEDRGMVSMSYTLAKRSVKGNPK